MLKLYKVSYSVTMRAMQPDGTSCTYEDYRTEIVEARNAAHATILQARLNDSRGWQTTMKDVAPIANHV